MINTTSFLHGLTYSGSGKKRDGMYPNSRIDDNPFIQLIFSFLIGIAKLFSLPIRIILRENFGGRYFTLIELLLYKPFILFIFSYSMIWILAIPYLLFNSSDFSSKLILVNFPILSIVFAIWTSIVLFKRFKELTNIKIDIQPTHSFFSGKSKYFTCLENQSIDQDIIQGEIEPFLLVSVGVVSLPLDPIFAIYLILCGKSLAFEKWYQNYRRKETLLDLTDSQFDSEYFEHMIEKFKINELDVLTLEGLRNRMIRGKDIFIVNDFEELSELKQILKK